jgi:dTDP-4-dehydrorhamnose 3,5-epimerase
MKGADIPIRGCVEIQDNVFNDERGAFVKPFSGAELGSIWPGAPWAECYWTRSHRGVVRGFHFQRPPCANEKLIFCPHGEVFDVLLDLRQGSPTFGKVHTLTVSAAAGNAVLIPEGIGHAFQATTDEAVLVYLVSSAYAPALDIGVRWNSAGVVWPLPAGPISARDATLPMLSDFESPFEYVESRF